MHQLYGVFGAELVYRQKLFFTYSDQIDDSRDVYPGFLVFCNTNARHFEIWIRILLRMRVLFGKRKPFWIERIFWDEHINHNASIIWDVRIIGSARII